MAISPNGAWLASAGVDQTIRIWSSDTGQHQILGRDEHLVSSLLFANENTLVAASFDGTIGVWDVRSRQILRCFGELLRFDAQELHCPRCLALSPDGKLLASGGNTSEICLWDLDAGEQMARLPGHKLPGECSGVAFSSDGARLISGGNDQYIRCWDVRSTRETHRLHAFESQVSAVTALPNEIVLAGTDGMIESSLLYWHPATEKRIAETDVTDEPTVAIAVALDGSLIATAGGFGSITLWESLTRRRLCKLHGHKKFVVSVAFSADGKKLVSAGSDGLLKLWDVTRCCGGSGGTREEVLADKLDRLWDLLGADDPSVAYGAIWALSAQPEAAVALCARRLKPSVRPDLARIPALIKQLDCDDFQARESASNQLLDYGPQFRNTIAAQREHSSTEVRMRIARVLERMDSDLPSADCLRACRAIKVLEEIGTQQARATLSTVAAGAANTLPTEVAKASHDRLRSKVENSESRRTVGASIARPSRGANREVDKGTGGG
jgi:WD40 repeat protein